MEVHTGRGGRRRGHDNVIWRSRSREVLRSQFPDSAQVWWREIARYVREGHLLGRRAIWQHLSIAPGEKADVEALAQITRQVHVVDEQHVKTERSRLRCAQRIDRLPERAAVCIAEAPHIRRPHVARNVPFARPTRSFFSMRTYTRMFD